MRRRFRIRRWRRWALPGLAAVALLAGCGDDEEEPVAGRAPAPTRTATATPTASGEPTASAEPTATASATPSATPTATQTASPEDQPGGAGDEATRVLGTFSVSGDQILPSELRVPARLGGVLEFLSGDATGRRITITPPLEGRSSVRTGETITLNGPRAGTYIVDAGKTVASLIFE